MGSVVGDQQQILAYPVGKSFGPVSGNAVDALPQGVLTARLDLSQHEGNLAAGRVFGEHEDYFFSQIGGDGLDAVESLLPLLALIGRPPFVQRGILASPLI